MQNQKTEPLPDDLPLLSPEEEVYVQELFLKVLTQKEAYKKAYGAEGYGDASLSVRACQKAAEPKIQKHLRFLQSVKVNNTAINLHEWISEELAFAQRCENQGNMGAAGATRDRINKMLGRYTDKMEIVNDADKALREIMAIDPDFAQRLQSNGTH